MENNSLFLGKNVVGIGRGVKSNLLVIGFGGCGSTALSAIIQQYDPAANQYLNMLAVETNQSVLAYRFTQFDSNGEEDKAYADRLAAWRKLENRFRVLQLGEEGLGAGGDMSRAEEMMRDPEQLASLREFLHLFKNVILVAGGGGGTCGAMPVVAELLRELGISTFAILAMPAFSEGPERVDKANIVKGRMRQICPTTIIENERFPDKSLDDQEAWQKINETSLFWILALLQALLQNFGDVRDLDGRDWEEGLKAGNFALPAFFDAGQRDLADIDQGLFGTPCLESRIIETAIKVVFWFEGSWPIHDREIVTECVKKRMNHAGKYEFKWGIRKRGVPQGTKTVGFVAFASADPDSARGKGDEGPSEVARVSIPLALGGGVESAAAVPEPSPEPTPVAHANVPEVAASVGTQNGGHASNGVLAAPTAVQADPADERTEWINGMVDNKPARALVSHALAKRFNALFNGNPTDALYKEALAVQELVFGETEKHFQVPTRGLQPVGNNR